MIRLSVRRNTVTVVLWVLLLFWMALLFFFSSQDASSSSAVSGTTIRTVVTAFSPSYRKMTPPKQNEMILMYQHLARKSAHAFLYLVLGILCAAALSRHIARPLLHVTCAEVICVLYACSDEFHQRFSSGRGPQITDVLLDSAGAICGILLLFFFLRLRRFQKDRRAKKRLLSAESIEESEHM